MEQSLSFLSDQISVRRLRRTWSAVRIIAGAVLLGAGYAARACHVLEGKADVAVVQHAEDRIGRVEERTANLEARSTSNEHNVGWVQDVLEQLALQQGIKPAPRPTPVPLPHPEVAAP